MREQQVTLLKLARRSAIDIRLTPKSQARITLQDREPLLTATQAIRISSRHGGDCATMTLDEGG